MNAAYSILSIVFLAVASLVLCVAVTVRRRRGQQVGKWLVTLLGAAAVLFVLTAIFDNLMIAVGLMTYAAGRISGASIGLAPIEDFAYPLAAVMLLPSLWTLAGGDRSREH